MMNMQTEPETTTEEAPDWIGTATYSPEDNKLRLYPFQRLEKDLYLRVKAAGFIWAPKQELFVAPMWTPEREDLLIELCGEVGDEDKSLVSRAAERAERFEDYSESRAEDAARARAGVSAIADNIPLGQPILVGHHSERHARKDAERIENGMRKTIKMWETSKYWADRAQGAIAHARYKEDPAVRQRRIKTLEAGKRSHERTLINSSKEWAFWSQEGITLEKAKQFSNSSHDQSFCWPLKDYPREKPASQYEGEMGIWSALGGSENLPIVTVEQCRARILPRLERWRERTSRWLMHYNNRIEYERAMLKEQGGTAADKFNFEIGGQVLRRGTWYVISKINRRDGAVSSLTVWGHFASTVQIDEVQDYRAPKPGDTDKVKALSVWPMVNYPGPGIFEMTKAEWDSIKAHQENKGGKKISGTEEIAAHRVRTMSNWCLRKLGKPTTDQWGFSQVYLTDVKRVDPPKKNAPAPKIERHQEPPRTCRTYEPDPEQQEIDGLKAALKTGVKVVSAPQLFPTPPELAERMAHLADIQPGHDVLEPSAGTGAILEKCFHMNGEGSFFVVEINHTLADALRTEYPMFNVICADFLAWNTPDHLARFDRIVMNPPFTKGSDVRHILHAYSMLKPCGKLVAICANGTRQQETLKPLADYWEDLPAGTFEESGTNVSTALLVMTAL